METKTRFNLTCAVSAWKQELTRQPGITVDQARELETHLLESVANLVRNGLFEEEAFWVALRRLGPSDRIAAEFVVAEPACIWRERVFWMASGIVGSHLLFLLFPVVLNALVNFLSRTGFTTPLWIRAALYVAVAVGLACLAFILAQGRASKPIQIIAETLGSPRRLAWGLGALLAVGASLQAISFGLTVPVSAWLARPDVWISILINTVWPGLMVFLLVHLAPRRVTG